MAGVGLLDGVHCECANGIRHEVVISHEGSAPKNRNRGALRGNPEF
jgi:hypothetical protein